MSQIELKPCAFCGSPAELERDSDHHGEWFNLGCSRHWGKMDEGACCGGRLWYTESPDNLDAAITAWNTRPLPSADRAEPVAWPDPLPEQIKHLDALADRIWQEEGGLTGKEIYANVANIMQSAPPTDKVELTREELIALIMEETTDDVVAEGVPLGKPNVLIQGCKFARRQYRDSPTDGYENPYDAAQKFAGFIADRILRRLSHSTGEG